MLKQYRILTECLLVLKKSNLPMMDKLRLEVQLIQAKRLLLNNEVRNKVRGIPESESDFLELHHLFLHICAPGSDCGEAPLLNHKVNQITEELKQHLNCRAPNPFDTTNGDPTL